MEKIYIETYGCSLNYADTEIMIGLLKKAGYEISENPEDAALMIINTCTVKGPTDSAFLKRLKELPKKPAIIAGCIPQAQYSKMKELNEYSVIGPHQLKRINEVVEETLNGNTVVLLAEEKHDNLELPYERKNSHIEIIPISSGCMGNCTYCITKKARGNLVSYDPKLIAKRMENAVKEGAKEIWITSQDNGVYGLDIGENLPNLLRKLISVQGDYKIRLGMANPDHVLVFIDELIEIYKSDKMFKFLHIPLQSANDDILKKMGRHYTAKNWLDIVSKFRENIPDISISTDIICGFPGETDEQFRETVYFLEKIRPDTINISRFWKRPGTSASRMKQQVEGSRIKQRSIWLTHSFHWMSFQKNRDWIGRECAIIIEEKGKDDTWIGRNDSYRQVIVQGDYKPGQKIIVKIVNNTIHDLRAVEIK